MKRFFKNFFQENKYKIFSFSFWRIVAFLQVLFWPYAFSKVVNILTQDPSNWQEAVFWAGLMILNNIVDDFVRLRAKFGLEKIGTKLKISLATFFSEKTAIREGKKTGEAVQAIKKASEAIESIVNFYKDDILQLPVNLVIIPLVLWQADISYLILLTFYGFLYLAVEYFAVRIYKRELKKYFCAAEIFWGTTYRQTPDFWRQREDGKVFAQRIEREGEELYKATTTAQNINSWRWAILQSLSSASLGAAVLLVIYRIINNSAPVGDLVLVSAYFTKTQETLNIITSAITKIMQTQISLKRLNEAVKVK